MSTRSLSTAGWYWPGSRTRAAAPLRAPDRGRLGRRQLRPAERHLLAAYAGLAAAALDPADAVATARRQGETARALLELARSLAEVVSYDDLAARLVEATGPLLEADDAHLMRWDEATETLSVHDFARLPTTTPDERNLTVSAAQQPRDGHDFETLLAVADTAMYRAEGLGAHRGQVVTGERRDTCCAATPTGT